MMHWTLIGRVICAFVVSVAALGVVRQSADASAARVIARSAIAPLVHMHHVYMRFAPPSRSTPVTDEVEMPLLIGTDPTTWRLRKTMAAHDPMAPYDPHPFSGASDIIPSSLAASITFAGMADSGSICQYSKHGCEPPDMAIAASPAFEVQAVNTSVAVFGPTGAIQPGWPKNSQVFFGIPDPGSCDTRGPFTSDPRAFYDPIDGRYWVAMLQLEGLIINRCPEQSIYWVAVSATRDPNGTWFVYAFDMLDNTTNIADFTQIGLDKRAFYFGGNMFDEHLAFKYDEIFAANKAAMEEGRPVTARGLTDITVDGTLVDTVQPALVEGSSPPAGIFVSSFNMNSDCSNSCSGINLIAMEHALTNPSLDVVTVPSSSYALAPNADQPICSQCIETFDTRISGTPVYSDGSMWFALETGVNNGSQTVPGVLWGEIAPTFSGSALTGGSMVQSGILSFTGDRAASFGAVMPDSAANLAMVFDSMSSREFPSTYDVARKHSDELGTLEAPRPLHRALLPTFDTRWGDYEAMSFEGSATNRIWLASQFSPPDEDWATAIGAVKFSP